MHDWHTVEQGPRWVEALHEAEKLAGLPTDLLARIAYVESHFIEGIIRGLIPSTAGALGMMQMLPRYFHAVNAPIPFTDESVLKQIGEAAGELARLHKLTGDWPLAVAAYNAGYLNIRRAGGIPPYVETQRYVAAVMSAVPEAQGVTV